MTLVSRHCPKCKEVVAVSHLRLDTEKVRAAVERTALEAHQCAEKAAESIAGGAVSDMQSLNVIEIPVKVCGNCKHWGEPWSNLPPTRPDGATGRNRCWRIMRSIEISSMDEWAHTAPDFGCVLFEAKEEA